MSTRVGGSWWLALGALMPVGCGTEVAGASSGGTSDVAPFVAWGEVFAANVCGRAEVPTILEANGGGLALFDADEDGDADLLLVSPGEYPVDGAPLGGSNRLYRNDGGRFRDVTTASGVDVPGWCNGVAVGDIDADGRRDLYLTRLGPNVLLRNAGGLRFEPVPDAAGAAGDEWSTSAVFLDLDRDGDLDLYVVNYLVFDPARPPLHGVDGRICLWQGQVVFCGPQGLTPQADRLYRNEDGRLLDVTVEQGAGVVPAFGLGVIDGDWNDDGWPDLYISNDSMPNTLLLSRGDGGLEDAGAISGAALSAHGREQAGMGIAAGDADGDGDEELFVTNFSMESNAFYTGIGGGRFRDVADVAGLGAASRTLLGWGTAFLDADLDGDLDLFTANGHVYPQADDGVTGTSFAQRDLYWRNDGRGRFTPLALRDEVAASSRALAVGDVDGDGVADVIVTSRDGAPVVWRGTADASRALSVRVHGAPGNPDAVGAELRLIDAQGERRHRVRSSGGYQAASDPRAYFAFRSTGVLHVTLPDGRSGKWRVERPGPLEVELPRP